MTPLFKQFLRHVEKNARADARTEVEAILDGDPEAVLDEAEAEERLGESESYASIMDSEVKEVYRKAYVNEFVSLGEEKN